MSNLTDQQDVIEFLSQAGNYGPHVHSVERYETHGSIVFLAGDHAYKLKRAVCFPYMDYSSLAKRQQMCSRELAVNRRAAPSLYLEVRPIIRDETGILRFGTEAEGESALDWVVVMRRFAQEALLETMRKTGALTRTLMCLLAQSIAEFHSSAEIATGFGGAAGIREVVDENTAILKTKIGRPFDAKIAEQYENRALQFLAKVTPALEKRRKEGHVRRCHGDLHLNNIVMLDKRPVLFDAIEFSDQFACIDVLYDLAFLLMDLDRHGLRDHANAVLNRYLEVTNEHAGLLALPLFLSCRAAVRAHTAVAASEAIDGIKHGSDQGAAIALLERAVAYLMPSPPRLVAIGGVSGTGKSTLARHLAPILGASPGAIVIRSDVIRKQLMGVAETVRLPDSAYEPRITQAVYARVAELATTILASGYSVVADAVYGKESERRAIAEKARRVGEGFDGLWLEAPTEVLEERISGRQGDVSDATVGVLHAQLQSVTAPQGWAHVRAEETPSETLANARRGLGC